jgi:hypothetical protein
MKKLTIGSAVYDDFDGVYFSFQSLRLNNQDIWDDLDLLIIDNNPNSSQGKATKSFCEKTRNIRYIPYTEKKSTAVRNQIFKHAEGEFCMSIDCHVLFEPNTIKKLINYFQANQETKDLFHGPMLYDVINGHDPTTHMDPQWRSDMFGTWGYDKRGNDPDGDPFEIPMHGLGIFACKTDAWLGFNEGFSGFGGEEGYIHKKFQKHGRKIWCLPFLRWLHRFDRPSGVKYPLKLDDRIKNYFIGHSELGLPHDDIIEHFESKVPKDSLIKMSKESLNGIKRESPKKHKSASELKQSTVKFWGDSKINFSSSDKFRYIKYEIHDSYDGHSSLNKISLAPTCDKAEIKYCNSEEPEYSARNLLKDDGTWRSNKSDQFKFPHIFVIDLSEEIAFQSIAAFTKEGQHFGMPKKFKAFVSKNDQDWLEISEVDMTKD